MKEIKSLRKSNEKHFLNKDGTITAYLYDRDIHYLKNNEYVEKKKISFIRQRMPHLLP